MTTTFIFASAATVEPLLKKRIVLFQTSLGVLAASRQYFMSTLGIPQSRVRLLAGYGTNKEARIFMLYQTIYLASENHLEVKRGSALCDFYFCR